MAESAQVDAETARASSDEPHQIDAGPAPDIEHAAAGVAVEIDESSR